MNSKGINSDAHLNLKQHPNLRMLTKNHVEELIPLEKQSYILPGPERIHVSVYGKYDPGHYERNYTMDGNLRTLYDPLRRGLEMSGSGNCLGWRPNDREGYQWLSYSTVLARATNFGAGLRHLGLNAKNLVGIYSKNRVEWILTEQGLYTYSMVSVPLYDTLGTSACRFILEQTELTTVVLEDESKLQSILQMRPLPPNLKHIILMESEVSPETRGAALDKGLDLFEFEEVEAWGRDRRGVYPDEPPDCEDVATINYTSGTTGDPKGAILLHKNFVAVVSSSLKSCQIIRLGPNDVSMSFLPLAHVYERMLSFIFLSQGASIGFYRGDVLKLVEDIKFLKPTILPCVPRLLNRIYDKVMMSANESFIKGHLMRFAVKQKSKEVKQGTLRRDSIWDLIVFSKIQAALGGRVRVVISGGAPINGNILEFFRCALGCTVFEGYGQTETAGPFMLTLPHEIRAGHVGPPCPACAIKLVDVPEMNYFSKEDQGEICVKGSVVFKGYYKNEEETKKVLDEEGWLHTGDIGLWLPSGALQIIDRKKHIFKLSQGEYVAPEKIENIYLSSPLVAQIYVHGDSLRSFLVGIVIPDYDSIKILYRNQDMNSLCRDPGVKSKILSNLTKLGKEARLQPFEQLKDIYLHPQLLTLEQGLLTPTMKSKRPELAKYFEKQIQDMYSIPRDRKK